MDSLKRTSGARNSSPSSLRADCPTALYCSDEYVMASKNGCPDLAVIQLLEVALYPYSEDDVLEVFDLFIGVPTCTEPPLRSPAFFLAST